MPENRSHDTPALKKSREELIRELDSLKAGLAAEKERCQALSLEISRLRSRELPASERRYRRLFDSMQEGFGLAEIILSEDGKPYDYRLLEVNAAFGRLTGGTPEAVTGKTIRELIPNVDPRWIKTCGRVALTGKPEHFEDESQSLGKWFDVYVFSTGQGKFGHLFIDITDRKRAEEDLRESEEKYRTIFNNVRDIVYVISLDRKIVSFNPAFERLTGRPVRNWIGKDVTPLIHPDDLALANSLLAKIASGRKVDPAALRILTQSGEYRLFEFRPTLLNKKDKTAGFLGTARDITESKRAEEKLRFLSSIVENITEAIIVTDTSFKINYMNRAAERLYGYPLSEIKGKRPDIFNAESSAGKIQNDIYETISSNKVILGVSLNKKKDGSTFYCEYKIMPLADENDEISAYIGLQRDITKRIRAEKALQKAHDSLEQRVLERTAELQERATQLAQLSSQLTLAEQRERRRIAEILHDNLQQLLVGAKIGQETLIYHIDIPQIAQAKLVLDLINQSIKISRSLTAELSPPILQFGDLSASLEWLAQWMFENQGLEVKLQIGAPLVLDQSDLTVLLFESIRELLLNVLKHSGEKSASVKVKHHNDTLRIDVSDRGVGFNPESLGKDKSSAQKFGLISIQERVMYLGGSFRIDSAPGSGSTISLIVPLSRKKAAENGLDLSREIDKKTVAELPGPKAPVGKFRVLIVDDHPVMREGLARMLRLHSDIEVVGEAPDGEKAIHLARKIVPDVILMDISMPHMDGLEATRIIHSELPRIRIIGLSMYEENDHATAMINAGASAYRSKSDDIDLLLATIRGEIK